MDLNIGCIYTVKFVIGIDEDWSIANINTATDTISIFSVVPPCVFISVLIHEIQHGLTSRYYGSIWHTIVENRSSDDIVSFVDEQVAVAAENGAQLYIDHEKEFKELSKKYKIFYNKNKEKTSKFIKKLGKDQYIVKKFLKHL